MAVMVVVTVVVAVVALAGEQFLLLPREVVAIYLDLFSFHLHSKLDSRAIK